ncbi:MAG TPA: response regulator [Candidatus Udaeobacter sp.]|jgi:CheY-like chemotaxis protein
MGSLDRVNIRFDRVAAACVLPRAAGVSPLDNGKMIRPCFLVVDRDYAGNISTRKLVIETAKLNVITAYSGREAVETLQMYPNLDGVVADISIDDLPFDDLVRSLKGIRPDVPVIAIGVPLTEPSQLADYQLDSFEPARLLELLKKIKPMKP